MLLGKIKKLENIRIIIPKEYRVIYLQTNAQQKVYQLSVKCNAKMVGLDFGFDDELFYPYF